MSLLFVLMTAKLLTSVSSTSAMLARSQPQAVKLAGHIAPLLDNLPVVGKLAGTIRLEHLQIYLKLRNQLELDALLVAQENLAAPEYHRYLSPLVFKNIFGPAQETVDKVSAYLKSCGFQVTAVAPNNLSISVSATVATIEKAFALTLNYYHLRGGLVYAPSTNPSVPATVAPDIQCIIGLDTVERFYQQKKSLQAGMGVVHGYTPGELRNAYNVSPLLNIGVNGHGQTIGLFELDGYNPADIDLFRKTYKLGPGKYSNVLVDGATNTPGVHALDVEKDMEMVSAIAPGAAQKVYIAPDTTTGVYDLYNQIVTEDTTSVITVGWGDCEAASGASTLNALNNILKQGAIQGQAFFAASGNAGAYGCGDNNLNVSTPVDSPYVIGVGGTSLSTGRNGSYTGEAAWSNPSPAPHVQGHGAGGGGGISAYFKRPSYQAGPYLKSTYRLIPDVSANADPATGDRIYCSVPAAGCSGWMVEGGTNAAAPLWAAIAADINQYLSDRHKPTLGRVNSDLYLLYTIPQPYVPFHDIITGTNLYYTASAGYDPTTGLGSPNAWNIARDLAVVIPLAILCRASDLDPTPHVAVLCRSASTNTVAVEMVVNLDGSAVLTSLPGDGLPNVDTQLPKGTIDNVSLDALLTQIGDVTTIPAHYCLKPISFGTITTITYHGQTSNDLSCLTSADQEDHHKLWHVVDDILSQYVQHAHT
ncbi:S53 family peptidase [Dictyobacter alpinus]|nr:S53 family peptidase [Dictyobacter alpinus]